MKAVVFVVLALFSVAAIAQFDPNKKTMVHVVTSSGNTCEMEFDGGDHPDKDTLKQMQSVCDKQARGKEILAITGPTDRDFAGMSQQQKKQYLCDQIRQKIQIQEDVEAAGSSGFYNMDYLRQIELQECGSNSTH